MKVDTTPFENTFGRKPFNFPEYLVGTSKIDAVDELLCHRPETFTNFRKKLLIAQEKMKLVTDSKCRYVTFNVGDQVMVRLRPSR